MCFLFSDAELKFFNEEELNDKILLRGVVIEEMREKYNLYVPYIVDA